jgi:hypothetical protein
MEHISELMENLNSGMDVVMEVSHKQISHRGSMVKVARDIVNLEVFEFSIIRSRIMKFSLESNAGI